MTNTSVEEKEGGAVKEEKKIEATATFYQVMLEHG
jgi:hypothetical protein